MYDSHNYYDKFISMPVYNYVAMYKVAFTMAVDRQTKVT